MTGLRVVVAGAAANIFSAHRQGLEAIEAQVIGVQDVNAVAAATVAAELGCPVLPTITDLLELPADLAIILAPHPFHADIAVAALRAGRHVLTEKPMAVEVGEADRMLMEAERASRFLMVAFQQRTRSEVREARRLIQSGFLGRIQRADVLASWPRRRSYFDVSPWRGTWRGEGGGILINQGQHDIDLLCHLAGPPMRVFGWVDHRLHNIETEDSALAMLEWGGGATGTVRISTAEVDVAQRIELTGTAGRLRLTPGRLETMANGVDFREFAASEGPPFEAPSAGPVRTVVGGGGDHVDLYRDLAGAIAGEHAPVAPAAEAAITLEVANAIVLSSFTRADVQLPLDRGAYRSLLESLRAAAETPRRRAGDPAHTGNVRRDGGPAAVLSPSLESPARPAEPPSAAAGQAR